MPAKITKEEFLITLSKNNEHFRNGLFVVTGEYINSRSNIEIETEYGKCISSVKTLMKNSLPTILSAIDKDSYFRNKLKRLNKHYKDGSFNIISEYVDTSTPLITLDKYGKCSLDPSSLLAGTKPNIETSLDKTSYFKNILLDANQSYREGEFILSGEYVDCSTPIKITTNTFERYITPNSLRTFKNKHRPHTSINEEYLLKTLELKNSNYRNGNFSILEVGSDSNSCIINTKYGLCKMNIDNLLANKSPDIRSAINKNEYFSLMAKEVHGGKYDYSNLEYRSNEDHVTISCPVHGDFKQSPSNHLAGKGCNLCATSESGFSKSKWVGKSNKYKSCKLYLLEISDGVESFLKVGITLRTVDIRYCELHKAGYSYNIKKELTSSDHSLIWDLEQKIKKKFYKDRYIPTTYFPGAKTEVFNISKYDDILKEIEIIEGRHFYL